MKKMIPVMMLSGIIGLSACGNKTEQPQQNADTLEVADTITEIKAICDCGAKATTNARLDADGYVVTEGAQLLLGGNDRYIAMCHKCWIRNIREHRKVK